MNVYRLISKFGFSAMLMLYLVYDDRNPVRYSCRRLQCVICYSHEILLVDYSPLGTA